MSDADGKNRVGILGASSLVGSCLLPLLKQDGCQVTAYSRYATEHTSNGVAWRRLHTSTLSSPLITEQEDLPFWICVAPIWVLPEHFPLLEAHGVRRVVILSSTSRFTKDDSSDLEERALALRLAGGETCVQEWARNQGVEWVILRPTLIYGFGQDKNISEIARFIRRFGFFPLLGNARGLRQPIHAEDVAVACIAALKSSESKYCSFNISGGETLTYRELVSRVFEALHRKPRLVRVPLVVFKLAVIFLSLLPRYRHWSVAMAERMNHDLVFDHSDASRDIGFSPRSFQLTLEDL